eukprot:TRINITY_DN7386_c0_g1_i1.p1 TRINITY_DN7386_c0_g1~~TRINITY_DN7386_c0_g1_i1.p1  ORF type:complete len:382 (+),score=69.49 TRINITY_DN7386_c0_g1_i1:130-1275(+)
MAYPDLFVAPRKGFFKSLQVSFEVSPLSANEKTQSLSHTSGSEVTFTANGAFPCRANVIPYFEVQLTTLLPNSCVAIGFVSGKFPSHDSLPGWKKGSVGWHSDDGHIFLGNGKGKEFSPSYHTVGSVVGCGIYSHHVFFTLNGSLVNTPIPIDSGVGLIPAVGLEMASVCADLGQSGDRFVTDVVALVAEAFPRVCLTLTLPNEILSLILNLAITSDHKLGSKDCLTLALVSRRWHSIVFSTLANPMWKWLSLQRWAYLADLDRMRVRNWQMFYRNRVVALGKEGNRYDVFPIENCPTMLEAHHGADLMCPAVDAKLRNVGGDLRHCDVCKTNVYKVYTEDDLERHIDLGHCVAFDVRGPPRMMMKGKPAPVKLRMRGKRG